VSFAEHTHPADEQIQIAPDDTDELVRAQARADIRRSGASSRVVAEESSSLTSDSEGW
jgi:hypothetical protein